MEIDLRPGAPWGALAHGPKVLGLLSMVLSGVSAILVADTVGGSAAGTVVSLLIGWWLYRHSIRMWGGSAPAPLSDVRG
jgi:hypothetical protein